MNTKDHRERTHHRDYDACSGMARLRVKRSRREIGKNRSYSLTSRHLKRCDKQESEIVLGNLEICINVTCLSCFMFVVVCVVLCLCCVWCVVVVLCCCCCVCCVCCVVVVCCVVFVYMCCVVFCVMFVVLLFCCICYVVCFILLLLYSWKWSWIKAETFESINRRIARD